MTVFLRKDIAKNYDLNSLIYKTVNGVKVYGRVDKVIFYGFRSKNTHVKFVFSKRPLL